MAKYQVESIRNIALCGHCSAGKTTMVDKILHRTKAINNVGTVDAGNSFCDCEEEEKAHKYTIESKVTHFDYKGVLFNLLDTPGYPDFIGQTIGALNGVDNAAIVINAQSGIEVNTRRVFHAAKDLGLGCFIVINKCDGDNIEFDELVEQIKDVFGSECFLMNKPNAVGSGFSAVESLLQDEAFIEQVVMCDDDWMMRFMDGEIPTEADLAVLLPKAVASGILVPILCTSSKNEIGLDELLDAFVLAGLNPSVITRTANDGEMELKCDPSEPFVAQVFKTRADPFVQKLSFFRVYQGTVKTGDTVPVTGSRKGLKIAQLYQMLGNQTVALDEAGPGYICTVTKAEDLQTSTTLGNATMADIIFPTPMVSLAAMPKSRGDEGKLSGALAKLCDEDSTFKRDQDPQTKELVITGMSELHLQILQERLKRRDKVEIDTKEPKIPYRETIQRSGDGSYRHKKQSGGSGQFGEVHIRMYPFPGGTDPAEFCTKEKFPTLKEFHLDPEFNFLWIDTVTQGSISDNFKPAIEKGFKERMTKGVIAGCKVQDIAVELYFGKMHDVDSNETAFKTAASMAFRNVFQECKPTLLEPVVKIEITIPNDKVGDISGDLSTRRGRPLGMESAGGGMQTIIAEIPLAEVTTYARVLASMTGGQGSYTIEFDRYDVVPGNIIQDIIAKHKMEEEEE
ncbi:MAG: elongation factor G [Thermoguttaceae bacterium]|nr:elongation factor G [Thermoguttaceae bacterium]MDO4856479.1 elongation factor G [Thermoguttaceae bacterium]